MQITVNQIQLYYEKRGRGPAIILLHGNGEDHTLFETLMWRLAPHFTVYALDSRGHGQSAMAALSYDLMTADVSAFIHQLNLDRPTILGFSDGGIVALMLAIAHPEQVGRLIVAGANLTPTGLKWTANLGFYLAFLFNRDPKLKMMFNAPHINPQDLTKITVPTLVLAGGRDLITPRETHRIVQLIPDAQLLILPGESHSSYIRDNTKLYAAIAPFLGL
ncbi:alpha/beta fold hydrolase [Lacticaseibacillus brantae]|uniref:Alpha beta superfamily hydrolase n=1 Tax=Lacticaseibacillus brantae DSM 23927 TaxID=1423727 RepID=A0A0R2AX73_9LACO|nr:alpha/beta hydrolase [Lacticaseibacillus brantae]KRM71632.1 Alpha beta superfamily hydrolase [Lacticaseibacillus brantae DSM 23927]